MCYSKRKKYMQVNKDIKTLWQYLKRYKQNVYFLIFLAILSSVFGAVIPYIYGKLVDIATKTSTTIELIFGILGLWLLLTLISNWIDRYVGRKSSIVAENATNDFSIDMFSHVMCLPVSFHKEKKMGEIIQRINRANDYFFRIIEEIVFSTAPGILKAIIGLIILTSVEWRLSIAIFLIIFLYGFVTILKAKPIMKSQKAFNKTEERIYGDVYNAMSNIQVVKSSVAETIEKKRNVKNFSNTVNKLRELLMIWNKLDVLQQTIIGCGFVFVFAGGIFLLRAGLLSAGTLVMFVGYTSLVLEPFSHLGYNYRVLKSATVVIGRALKLSKIKPEKYSGGLDLKQIKGEIKFENVSFSYKKRRNRTLKDIDFQVNAGETVALVGPSGVGKTTLVDLISRYNSPISGRVMIDGKDIETVNLESLRKNIAIVPQEITLFNDTIENNIAYGKPRADFKDIVRASIAANAHEFIGKFPKKYKQIVGERGVKLSTGQKQRIAIARALLKDPKILILDEATSNLDSESERLIQEALMHIIKGRTTFIIAHRLSTIRHADQIFVFNKGQIVERGKHDELMKKENGIYRNFYMMQSAYNEEEKKDEQEIPAQN
jgi:ABC-type multidrug transport system fused ATPase/permease subunit